MADILSSDAWLSEIIGKDAYALKDAPDEAAFAAGLESICSKHNVFCFTKVAVDRITRCSALESAGFRLIDTSVLFSTTIASAVDAGGIVIRDAAPGDLAAVREIARSSFRFSRFHLDPHITKVAADTLKAEWAANYFAGKRGDRMLIAEAGDEVLGFSQLLCPDQKTTIIDLIAVKVDAQGRGIGRALVNASNRTRSADGVFKIGTQLANSPSMRLYSQCGLSIESAQYIFHYHSA